MRRYLVYFLSQLSIQVLGYFTTHTHACPNARHREQDLNLRGTKTRDCIPKPRSCIKRSIYPCSTHIDQDLSGPFGCMTIVVITSNTNSTVNIIDQDLSGPFGCMTIVVITSNTNSTVNIKSCIYSSCHEYDYHHSTTLGSQVVTGKLMESRRAPESHRTEPYRTEWRRPQRQHVRKVVGSPVLSNPRGSKYPVFNVFGLRIHTLNGIWDQSP